MAEIKRYYWLKLPHDFFNSKRIKKLRKVSGGDTFTIIYLKMQLLSLKTDGILTYTGLEQSFAEELALDLDEDVENVQVTLRFLSDSGLIETSDNIEFFLPFVAENTGCETAVAQRVRNYRERQRALQCNTDVTDVKHLCNVEIEKEIDKEIEKEIEKSKSKSKSKKKEKVAAPVYFPNDELLEKAFSDFRIMRNRIKRPMTDSAIERMIARLNKLDSDTAIDVLHKSTDNCWLDIYPEKKEKKNKSLLDEWRDA